MENWLLLGLFQSSMTVIQQPSVTNQQDDLTLLRNIKTILELFYRKIIFFLKAF